MIGGVNESMQDFNNFVGIRSREQEESVELSIVFRTSFSVTGSKFESWGGEDDMGLLAKQKLFTHGGIEAQRLVILSLKKFRNEEASADGELAEGRDFGILRLRREFMACQSCFGLSLFSLMTCLK